MASRPDLRLVDDSGPDHEPVDDTDANHEPAEDEDTNPRRVLFGDYKPVPVADIDDAVGDDSTAERKDGPKPAPGKRRRRKDGHRRTAPRKPSPKKVRGDKIDPSDLQWMEAVACLRPLWDLALQVQAIMEATDTATRKSEAGRRRGYNAFEAMFIDVVAWKFGAYKWVFRNLADLRNWNVLRRAVQDAYPDDARLRLSERPISRSQHYRFSKQYITDHLLEVMHDTVDRACVEAAQSTGMLQPGVGSLTNPDPYSFVSADGCWIPAMSSLTRDDAVDPETGEIVRRFDPDALPYHNSNGERARSPGHLLAMVIARSNMTQERIILSMRLKSAKTPHTPRNDATISVDLLLELIEKFPYLRAGLVGLVYDMALSTADFDRLLDAGLIPVSKVARTSTGKVATQNLGMHKFKAKDGSVHERIVTAVHGTPCITVINGNGIDFYVPLKLLQVKKTSRKKRPQINTFWTIPADKTDEGEADELVPFELRDAQTRIRHTRTKKERDAGRSRSRALRIFPESDARFPNFIGRRQDSESANSDLKSRLWNRRCRALGHNRVDFTKIAYQVHVLITALAAHHEHTGADMTRWFGKHRIAAGDTPLQQAA